MSGSDFDRCYTSALRILGFRFNSEAELRRKLEAKRFEGDDVDAAIERLRGEGWIDDDRFAAGFVRARMQKRIGKLRIRRELIAAGVGDESIEAALRENVDAEAEEADLRALVRKRGRILIGRRGNDYIATAEGRNKLTGYLLNQGYDAALVRSAVGEFIREIRVAHD